MTKLTEIKVPKVVQQLDLSAYSESLAEVKMFVWCNPSARLFREWEEIQTQSRKLTTAATPTNSLLDRLLFSKARIKRLESEAKEVNRRTYAWYSEIWSQGKNPDYHVGADDVENFHRGCTIDPEGDPQLWAWLTERTQAMIIAHINGLEKN